MTKELDNGKGVRALEIRCQMEDFPYTQQEKLDFYCYEIAHICAFSEMHVRDFHNMIDDIFHNYAFLSRVIRENFKDELDTKKKKKKGEQ